MLTAVEDQQSDIQVTWLSLLSSRSLAVKDYWYIRQLVATGGQSVMDSRTLVSLLLVILRNTLRKIYQNTSKEGVNRSNTILLIRPVINSLDQKLANITNCTLEFVVKLKPNYTHKTLCDQTRLILTIRYWVSGSYSVYEKM